MGEELTPQKEKFLQEVEQKLLHRELDAKLLENGLIHVRWNEKPLCSVDSTIREIELSLLAPLCKGSWHSAVQYFRCYF